MHNVNGLAHLDLKPDNIVILNDLSLALIDFGHTNQMATPVCHTTGTDMYMPPEVRRTLYKAKMYYLPEKADAFSLGVCLFILMFQKMPFGIAEPNDGFYRYVWKKDFNEFFMKHKAHG